MLSRLRALPRPAWILFLGTFLNKFGTFVLPFLTLYLTQRGFTLSDAGEGTAMKWAAEVKLAGPVASMGQRVLQPIVNQQVQHVLNALDQQIQAAIADAKS